MTEINKNHFIYRKYFPDTKSILNRKPKDIKDIFSDALFVLDTNALLVPYNIGKENLEQISKVYKKLITKNRLFIPEQVLREFANNRSNKIGNIFSDIDNLLSNIPLIKSFEYPILAELEAYKSLNDSRKLIQENIKRYKQHLNDLKIGITEWNWSDPVTLMYQNTFEEKNIVEPSFSEEELIKEYYQRIEDNIPPGNKDKSKSINAIGDFVIWKTILDLGKKIGNDVIFISNDEKNDWFLKGNQQSVSTKFELVDEFYRYTGGYHFLSINFTSFLEHQGLELNIKERLLENLDRIYESVRDLSNETVLQSLKIIEGSIIEFLDCTEHSNDDDLCITETINKHIINFLNNYRKEYFGTDDWQFYAGYFRLFDEWLTEIKSLNSTIIYESHRMKRGTETEFIKLKALCEAFIEKYSVFEIIT